MYYYFVFPLVFSISIIFLVVCLILRRKRLQKLRERQALANQHIFIQSYPNMLELQSINMHPTSCIFGDNNPPFWILNCGAYVCNLCISDFVSRYSVNDFTCSHCSQPCVSFSFVNRYRGGGRNEINHHLSSNRVNTNQPIISNGPYMQGHQGPHIQNDNQIDNVIQNLKPDQVCNICFERPMSKYLNCESNAKHMLCEACYYQLIDVQKISLCPYCRTKITGNAVPIPIG
jgi:hypothetical protein